MHGRKARTAATHPFSNYTDVFVLRSLKRGIFQGSTEPFVCAAERDPRQFRRVVDANHQSILTECMLKGRHDVLSHIETVLPGSLVNDWNKRDAVHVMDAYLSASFDNIENRGVSWVEAGQEACMALLAAHRSNAFLLPLTGSTGYRSSNYVADMAACYGLAGVVQGLVHHEPLIREHLGIRDLVIFDVDESLKMLVRGTAGLLDVVDNRTQETKNEEYVKCLLLMLTNASERLLASGSAKLKSAYEHGATLAREGKAPRHAEAVLAVMEKLLFDGVVWLRRYGPFATLAEWTRETHAEFPEGFRRALCITIVSILMANNQEENDDNNESGLLLRHPDRWVRRRKIFTSKGVAASKMVWERERIISANQVLTFVDTLGPSLPRAYRAWGMNGVYSDFELTEERHVGRAPPSHA